MISAARTDDGASSTISDSALRAFQKDGVVLLRNVVSAEELQQLEKGISYNLEHPGPLAGVASSDSDPGSFNEDFCNWGRIQEYRDFLFHSRLPTIASQLLQSRRIRLYHDHVLVKESNTAQHTPWHQDQPYYNIDGDQNVSFWIPIDPVPRESSLQFLPVSHKSKTWFMPRTFMNMEAKWFPEGSLPDVPPLIQTEFFRGTYNQAMSLLSTC